MSYSRLNTNTTTSGSSLFLLGSQGATITAADTITITSSIHEVSGSATINTINGGSPNQGLLLLRPVGATWTIGGSGNINASSDAQEERFTFLITADGTTWYGANTVTGTTFTPYGHIAATTVQGAIQELVDEKTNTPNLTEDTSPDTANDYLTTWDTSASAYKKVKPQNLGALLKTGGTMTGPVLFADGSASAPSVAASGDSNTGIRFDSTEKRIIFVHDGTDEFMFDTNALRLDSGGVLGWSTTADPTATPDTTLRRGTGTRTLLVQADGTNASTFIVNFNGTTGTQYLQAAASGGNSQISAYGGELLLDGKNTGVQFQVGGTTYWLVNATALYPNTTNAYDLGASSKVLQSAYVGTSIQGVRTKTLTESSATAFVRIAVASNTGVGGYIEYSIYAGDASNQHQVRTGILNFALVNSSGSGKVATLGRPDGQTTVNDTTDIVAVNSGTLTNTFTADTSPTDAVDIKANAASSLTQTTLEIRYRVVITSGVATVTPQ